MCSTLLVVPGLRLAVPAADRQPDACRDRQLYPAVVSSWGRYARRMSRRTSYGIDAPGVPFGLASGGVILLLVAIVNAVLDVGRWAALGPLLGSVTLPSSVTEPS